MKQYKNIRGTQEKVANLEVNIDTVYVRENITRIETDDFTGWEYDEIQYSLREYQENVGKKTNTLGVDVNEVAEMVVVSYSDLMTIADLLYYAIDEIKTLKGGNL